MDRYMKFKKVTAKRIELDNDVTKVDVPLTDVYEGIKIENRGDAVIAYINMRPEEQLKEDGILIYDSIELKDIEIKSISLELAEAPEPVVDVQEATEEGTNEEVNVPNIGIKLDSMVQIILMK